MSRELDLQALRLLVHLEEEGSLGAAGLTVEHIQDVTCEAFGVTRDDLLSTSRAASVAWPRQVAMYLAREHTSESLPSIGRSFGKAWMKWSHSCVLANLSCSGCMVIASCW